MCSALRICNACVPKRGKQPLTETVRLCVAVAQEPAFLGSALSELHAIQVHLA